ncbi:MAG: VTT domain-containing protein [Thaumarchaeota archaeon]|nr:VTT domain-containing protein [Nitrososphaerota archaeon]
MQFTDLIPFTPEVGYFGLTIISFFGSLIPFVPVPSFLLLATMSVGDKFDIHILAILAAVTSTVAKQIIFYASYSGRRIINEATRKRMKPFERLVRRYGAAAAFVAAATPVPDDVVYIPLGLAKYNPKRFFLATFAGKIILSYAVVLLSRFFGLSYVEPFIENVEDPATIYIGFAIFAVLMTIIVILMLRLNWAKILGQVAPWTLKDDEKS